MKFAPLPLLVNTPIDISQAFRFSVQANFTGSPTGTLTIQVSNDSSATPVNWANALAPISISANGSTYYGFPDTPAKWMKVTYTGTGTGAYTLFTQSA